MAARNAIGATSGRHSHRRTAICPSAAARYAPDVELAPA
jgi:hypothetical protein